MNDWIDVGFLVGFLVINWYFRYRDYKKIEALEAQVAEQDALIVRLSK